MLRSIFKANNNKSKVSNMIIIYNCINLLLNGRFYRPKTTVRGGKTKFLDFSFMGASAKKSWEKSRIFRYGLPLDFFSRGPKTMENRVNHSST